MIIYIYRQAYCYDSVWRERRECVEKNIEKEVETDKYTHVCIPIQLCVYFMRLNTMRQCGIRKDQSGKPNQPILENSLPTTVPTNIIRLVGAELNCDR